VASRKGRPSLQDVAKAAGVSPGLVSFALNDRPGVGSATKEKILAIAREMGYQPNPHARALRTGSSGMLGLMVRDLLNPYYIDVIGGAQDAAFSAGGTVLVVDAGASAEREREHIERLARSNVDALAIAPIGGGESIALWQQLRPGRPTVVLNALVPQLTQVSRVSIDRHTAVGLAVDHLADLGHRRIAFLSHSTSVLADHERRDIFLDVAPRRDVEPVVVETGLDPHSVREQGLTMLRAADRPTAVLANSDFAAYAIYEAAAELGLRIGTDLSVVGQDDLATSAIVDPPLTTIRMDRRSIGRALFERMVADGPPADHVEPVHLVVRRSTGRVRGASGTGSL
jgi:DNA-binding LacI/PurR family transcriptional regulator